MKGHVPENQPPGHREYRKRSGYKVIPYVRKNLLPDNECTEGKGYDD